MSFVRFFPRRGACRWATAWLLVWLLVCLSGCASPPTPTASGPAASAVSDAVADRADSPQRRRAQLRLALALAYFEQGQDSVALDELRQALAADPSLAEGWSLRGLVLMRQGQWEAAEQSLRRAAELAPADADVVHNLGWLLCQRPSPAPAERLAQARPWFERALAQPGYREASKTWAALGLCQQQAGRLQEAELSLRRALALEGRAPRAGLPLAELLARQGRWAESLSLLEAWHAQAPASAASLWLGVRAARKLDNPRLLATWGEQLRREFGRSPQALALDKGLFDE